MKPLTLILSLFLLFNCTENKKGFIAKETIVSLQPFNEFDAKLTDSIARNLEKIYSVKVVILPKIDLPKESITTFKGIRYDASKLIKHLKENKNESIDYVMGLSSQDICITKVDKDGNILKPENKYRDFGIFGLGYRPGVSAIVSTKRLENTHSKIFVERLKKVTTHEFGHNLGIPHCTNADFCVMQSAAEKLSTVDALELRLCKLCWEIAQKQIP